MAALRVFVVLALFAVACCYKTYSGYQTLRITITGEEDANIITAITEDERHYDVWKEARRPGDSFDVMVDPETVDHFKAQLETFSLSYNVLVPDVGVNVVRQMEKVAASKGEKRNWEAFWELPTVEAWIDEMATTYSSVTTVFTAGSSFEGRTIRGLKLSTGGTGKPSVWVDSCIHSREWIACSSNMYQTEKLLQNYEAGDLDAISVLNAIDIYIVPVFNVDGYVYTFTDDRMWRKTRSTNTGTSCMGADPNRNWDYFHCQRGSSTNPCSDTFCGSGPFSEIEVDSVVNYITTSVPNLQAYVAIHSFGNWWMSTYAHYVTDPADHPEMMAVCARIVSALQDVDGEVFECDTISSFVGTTSGSSVDYVKDNLGVKYNFAPELRGGGFVISESNIIPSGEEVYAGMMELYKTVRDDNA